MCVVQVLSANGTPGTIIGPFADPPAASAWVVKAMTEQHNRYLRFTVIPLSKPEEWT